MLGERNLSPALPFGRKRASLSLKVEPLVCAVAFIIYRAVLFHLNAELLNSLVRRRESRAPNWTLEGLSAKKR